MGGRRPNKPSAICSHRGNYHNDVFLCQTVIRLHAMAVLKMLIFTHSMVVHLSFITMFPFGLFTHKLHMLNVLVIC